ncbi:hypothetical protein THI4931_24820 [Pandoraea sputorum]|nr:hypothetical protein THI4931_24820 [Pandoraea sputorum]
MLVDTVSRIQYGGDAALCPVARTFGHRTFGDERHAAGIGQMQGDGLAGKPAADDDDIEIHDTRGVWDRRSDTRAILVMGEEPV